MEQLYLCRHGETEWALLGRHTGTTDISLTEKGKGQALLIKKRLQNVKFDKVFTSPKKRASATCEGFDAVAAPLTVEWDYGEYEGLTTKEIAQKNPTWNLFANGAPGGESAEQVGERADQFLKTLSQYKGKVALFSHAHFLRVLTARFLGLPPEGGKLLLLSIASISILSYERKEPVIALWNDTCHLT